MTMMLNDILKASLQNIVREHSEDFPKSVRNEGENRKMSYAFVIHSLTEILDLDRATAIKHITDGGDDMSIDAIYVDDEKKSIHFFSNKFSKEVQKRTFPENDFKLLNNSISIIMKKNGMSSFKTLKSKANYTLKQKIGEINDLVQKHQDAEVHIHIVTNSEKDNVIDNYSKEENYEYHAYGLPRLVGHQETSEDISYQITSDDDGLYKKCIIDQEITAYFLSLSAESLAKLYGDGKKENMLANNIRYYLGNTKINKKIKEAIEKEDDKSLFWACNNGICIICKKAVKGHEDNSGKRRLTIVNPKIINGGQTTNAIYEKYKSNPSQLQSISIPVRIYETSNEDVIAKITEGLNSQNNIFSRDVKSYNPIQKKVVEFFKAKNIYLSIKRKEKFDNNNPVISNEVVFQSYIALYEERPSEAKSSKSKIFENDFDRVFNLSNQDIHLKFYRSYELYKIVEDKESKLKKIPSNNFIQHADFALIYAMGKINPQAKDINTDIQDIKDLYNKSFKIIKKIVKEQGKKPGKGNYSHNNLFKSNEITKLINKKIK